MSERARSSTAAGILATLIVGILAPGVASAQPGRAGIGAQVGSSAGLTLRILLEDEADTRSSLNALTVQATFDLDDYYLLQAHVSREFGIRRSPIGLFFGPGVAVGRDRGDQSLAAGVMGGARFYRGRFEVHFQVSPRIQMVPEWRGLMGAGVGLRYYP